MTSTSAEIPGPAELTLEEKASLTSGADFWTTKAVERAGVPAMMLTDGPHGLRKQAGASDHLGPQRERAGDLLPARRGARLLVGCRAGRAGG